MTAGINKERKRLDLRVMPNIDQALHNIAVKVNDDLQFMLDQEQFTNADIMKIKEIVNLLLLVRRQMMPDKPTNSSKSTDFEDLTT